MKKKQIGLILVSILVIIGCGFLFTRLHKQWSVNQTAYEMQALNHHSPKSITSIAQAQKMSKKELTATLIMKADCDHCRSTLKFLQNLKGKTQIPFGVIDGTKSDVKNLQSQLSAKQTPCLIIWEKQAPAFVFVGDGSKKSSQQLIKLLNNQNIDNHDLPIKRINDTAFWYHNEDAHVISRSEVPSLRGFSNNSSMQ